MTYTGDIITERLNTVGSLAEWEAVVSDVVARWTRIDVLVNNAGVIRTEGFIDETEQGWAEVIRVDQFGIFCGLKTVLPVMVAQRAGSIINISSNMGIAAIPDYAAYHAAKGAVVMMTKSMYCGYAGASPVSGRTKAPR